MTIYNTHRPHKRITAGNGVLDSLPPDVMFNILARLLMCHAPSFFHLRATSRALQLITPEEVLKHVYPDKNVTRNWRHWPLQWRTYLGQTSCQSSDYGRSIAHLGLNQWHSTANVHFGPIIPDVGVVRWTVKLGVETSSRRIEKSGSRKDLLLGVSAVGIATNAYAIVYIPSTREVRRFRIDGSENCLGIRTGGAWFVHGTEADGIASHTIDGRIMRGDVEGQHTFIMDNHTGALSIQIGSHGPVHVLSSMVRRELTPLDLDFPDGVYSKFDNVVRPFTILFSDTSTIPVKATLGTSFNIAL
jgi:hypothetical protein